MSDYISREAVSVGLAVKVKRRDFDAIDLQDAQKFIYSIPAADVRPVKEGHWVPVTNGRGGHECDQCHDYAPSYPTGEERLSDFCPNCGAKMGGTP